MKRLPFKSKIKLIFSLSIFTTSFFLSAESISFSATSMTGSTAENSEKTVLTGNASIVTTDMTLSADKIELLGSDFRFIKASGNIKGTNTKSKFDFTCDELSFDRKNEIAVLQGNVTMDDSSNDIKAQAQLIEYNQKTDIATMQISVSITQGENICTSAMALYKKNIKQLELTGNPIISKGEDTFRAQEIKFNIDTEEIILDGKVRGSVTDQVKETEKK